MTKIAHDAATLWAGCAYANECLLFKTRHALPPRQRRSVLDALCHDADAAQRCRRARYHAVYGDDPPLSMLPVSGRADGWVWLRSA